MSVEEIPFVCSVQDARALGIQGQIASIYHGLMKTRPDHWINKAIDLSRFPVPIVVEAWDQSNATCPSGFTAIRVTLVVLNRDSGEPARVQQEAHVHCSGRHEVVIEGVYGLVKKMVLHELDECFMVYGERVKDPHADEIVIHQYPHPLPPFRGKDR